MDGRWTRVASRTYANEYAVAAAELGLADGAARVQEALAKEILSRKRNVEQGRGCNSAENKARQVHSSQQT